MQNDIRQTRSMNRVRDGRRDISKQSIELIKQILNYIVKEQGMGGKKRNEKKVGEIKKFGSGTVGKHHDDEANVNDLFKPIIAGAIVQAKKQLAAKERAISLYGVIQRVTGDFWVAFANTMKTIGNFFEILFPPIPILKATQPPLLKI